MNRPTHAHTARVKLPTIKEIAKGLAADPKYQKDYQAYPEAITRWHSTMRKQRQVSKLQGIKDGRVAQLLRMLKTTRPDCVAAREALSNYAARKITGGDLCNHINAGLTPTRWCVSCVVVGRPPLDHFSASEDAGSLSAWHLIAMCIQAGIRLDRFRFCLAPDCSKGPLKGLFWDASSNGQGRYCSETCKGRTTQAAYRQRNRQGQR